LAAVGPLAALDHAGRRAFLRDRVYVDGVGLSVSANGSTAVSAADVNGLDWLVGTVAAVYALVGDPRGVDSLTEIAMKDHVARLMRVHPSKVQADVGRSLAILADQEFPLVVTQSVNRVEVREGSR
jgi:hypothetical protein